jgi:serine/threonine protein kinase
MQPETDFPTDLRALENSYELIRELGQGRMAAVYLARHRASGKLVAIKAIRARYLDDWDALQRFTREARTVADLSHPNIVRTEAIEDFGDRAVAIITEYVAGGTVRDRLREYGAFSAEDAESVLRDVANALGYAHRRGIVHRDVKPENVFLDKPTGRALLTDFGSARRIEGDVRITLLGASLGTPQYMSPEQIDGREVDGRTDIYSLGVLGWELLTGKRPWAGENLSGVIYKQKHEDLPRITSMRPRVPANLLFAIEGALVKERTRRWQSMDQFLGLLTYNPPPVLSQSQPSPLRPIEDEPTVRFRRVPEPNDRTSPWPPSAPAASPLPRVESAPAPIPQSRRVTQRTRRRGVGRRVLVLLALIVPLAIAGVSWYTPLGGRLAGAWRHLGRASVTASAGSLSLDTARAGDTAASVRDTAPSNRAAPASSRCEIPSMPDQQACLRAVVAVNDAPLQRVYDSLVVEMRRRANVPRGGSDPPAVTQLRVEQRRWIAARDLECTRDPAPGFVPLWAEPISKCFARMAAARRAELASTLSRVRAEPR